MTRSWHAESHYSQRIGWLRASVLGANDGIVSTASLVVGVAAAEAAPGQVLIAGVAGLVAGAMSMAAGEYVSVSSQADTERADLRRETQELERNPAFELEELTKIYVSRGLDRDLAQEVARQLTERDALGAHRREELGLSETHEARPLQAAIASAGAFAAGAILPLGVVLLVEPTYLTFVVSGASLVALAALGALAARTGGAAVIPGAVRVALWGAGAMALTALVGRAFGAVV